jgi:hypothetical protein
MHVKLKMTIVLSKLVLEREGDDSTIKVNNMKVNKKTLRRGKQRFVAVPELRAKTEMNTF